MVRTNLILTCLHYFLGPQNSRGSTAVYGWKGVYSVHERAAQDVSAKEIDTRNFEAFVVDGIYAQAMEIC
jgi:hypothetical protein